MIAYAQHEKCIVAGCRNRKDEGAFVKDDLCVTCHDMLSAGKITSPGYDFIHDLAEQVCAAEERAAYAEAEVAELRSARAPAQAPPDGNIGVEDLLVRSNNEYLRRSHAAETRINELLHSNNEYLQRARDAEAREQKLLQTFHAITLTMQGGKFTHKEKGGTYFAVRCKVKIPAPVGALPGNDLYWEDGYVYVSAHSGELFTRTAENFKKSLAPVLS